MTVLTSPNRSSIFSRTLFLFKLALWRLGLRTLDFVDDIILLDMPPSAAPEADPHPGLLQALGRAPSPSPRAQLDAKSSRGAPAATSVCKYPSCGRQTWAPYDFCVNTHAIMEGAKPLDSVYSPRGVQQTHTWDRVAKTCTRLAPAPAPTAPSYHPVSRSVVDQTSPPPLDESWKWGWSPSPPPGRQHYE